LLDVAGCILVAQYLLGEKIKIVLKLVSTELVYRETCFLV